MYCFILHLLEKTGLLTNLNKLFLFDVNNKQAFAPLTFNILIAANEKNFYP